MEEAFVLPAEKNSEKFGFCGRDGRKPVWFPSEFVENCHSVSMLII